MSIGLLTLHVHLPGCASLKEKRSRIKPLVARLHREFNISVAEIDHLDTWQDAFIGCAMVSNDNGFTQRTLQQIVRWVEVNWHDISLVEERYEFF